MALGQPRLRHIAAKDRRNAFAAPERERSLNRAAPARVGSGSGCRELPIPFPSRALTRHWTGLRVDSRRGARASRRRRLERLDPVGRHHEACAGGSRRRSNRQAASTHGTVNSSCGAIPRECSVYRLINSMYPRGYTNSVRERGARFPSPCSLAKFAMYPAEYIKNRFQEELTLSLFGDSPDAWGQS